MATREAPKGANKADLYCLWIDKDTGNVSSSPYNALAERVSLGGYVPSRIGTKSEIQRVLNEIKKKPYLVEKYFKDRA